MYFKYKFATTAAKEKKLVYFQKSRVKRWTFLQITKKTSNHRGVPESFDEILFDR